MTLACLAAGRGIEWLPGKALGVAVMATEKP